MRAKSLDEILSGFNPSESTSESSLKQRDAVTIWLPPAAKARYDRLQELSNRRFSKKVREILLAAIEQAEARAS